MRRWQNLKQRMDNDMEPKNKNENAKNKDWQTPMKMPGVKPGDYDKSTETPGGKRMPAGEV